jgi:hypothetical protein
MDDQARKLDATIEKLATMPLGHVDLNGWERACQLYPPMSWDRRVDVSTWHAICTPRVFIPAGMPTRSVDERVESLMLELLGDARTQLQAGGDNYLGITIPAVYFVHRTDADAHGRAVADVLDGFEFFAFLHLRRRDKETSTGQAA